LLPLPPPEGFPVVLGAFTGFVFFSIAKMIIVIPTIVGVSVSPNKTAFSSFAFFRLNSIKLFASVTLIFFVGSICSRGSFVRIFDVRLMI
jgi:hypothetical protein